MNDLSGANIVVVGERAEALVGKSLDLGAQAELRSHVPQFVLPHDTAERAEFLEGIHAHIPFGSLTVASNALTNSSLELYRMAGPQLRQSE